MAVYVMKDDLIVFEKRTKSALKKVFARNLTQEEEKYYKYYVKKSANDLNKGDTLKELMSKDDPVSKNTVAVINKLNSSEYKDKVKYKAMQLLRSLQNTHESHIKPKWYQFVKRHYYNKEQKMINRIKDKLVSDSLTLEEARLSMDTANNDRFNEYTKPLRELTYYSKREKLSNDKAINEIDNTKTIDKEAFALNNPPIANTKLVPNVNAA